LFVHCWNARQMLRQRYPRYRRGLSEFISPWLEHSPA